jgi:hypothetical protein
MAEAAGIPSFVMTRLGFEDVVNNAFASLGFSFEGPKYVFPSETFLADSDLTPINENIDKVVWGLTKWEPEVKETGIFPVERIKVEGRDYEEAAANMNELFMKNLWGDGHTLLPPTEEQVEWMLRGTDLSRDTLVAKVAPAQGLATVEAIAANAVMAGCRPEYMPVLIAAVEALTDPEFSLSKLQATTGPHWPLLIINGPIRKQLDINYSSGIFGPGWKANATIGRAVRLILLNLGGAFPGISNMATQAHPGHYGMCIGENEEALSGTGWNPHHVEMGFDKDTSTVTVVSVCSIITTGYGGLRSMAETMKACTKDPGPSEGGVATMECIFSPEDFKTYVLPGYECDLPFFKLSVPPAPTKKDAAKYLYENSFIRFDEYLLHQELESIKRGHYDPGGSKEAWAKENYGKMVPEVPSPEGHIFAFVSGGIGLHSVLVTTSTYPMMMREITLPKNWSELLEEAKPHVREPFA